MWRQLHLVPPLAPLLLLPLVPPLVPPPPLLEATLAPPQMLLPPLRPRLLLLVLVLVLLAVAHPPLLQHPLQPQPVHHLLLLQHQTPQHLQRQALHRLHQRRPGRLCQLLAQQPALQLGRP